MQGITDWEWGWGDICMYVNLEKNKKNIKNLKEISKKYQKIFKNTTTTTYSIHDRIYVCKNVCISKKSLKNL